MYVLFQDQHLEHDNKRRTLVKGMLENHQESEHSLNSLIFYRKIVGAFS